SKGSPAARKGRKSRSVRPDDAIHPRRRDRAVRLEIGVEGVDVIDADLLAGSLLEYAKAIAADRKIIVHGDAIVRGRIDPFAVQRQASGDDPRAVRFCGVPRVAETLGDL